MMASYMRIVRAHPPDGMADDAGRQWAAFMPERLRQIPGFRHGHFGVDRATGDVVGVTVSDQPPDEARARQLMQEFTAQLGAAAPTAPPQVTVYEIIAEA